MTTWEKSLCSTFINLFILVSRFFRFTFRVLVLDRILVLGNSVVWSSIFSFGFYFFMVSSCCCFCFRWYFKVQLFFFLVFCVAVGLFNIVIFNMIFCIFQVGQCFQSWVMCFCVVLFFGQVEFFFRQVLCFFILVLRLDCGGICFFILFGCGFKVIG